MNISCFAVFNSTTRFSPIETLFCRSPPVLGVVCVADHLVEVRPFILCEIEVISKRISAQQFVQTLLVQSVHIDVGRVGIALGFSMRKPRSIRTDCTRIVNTSAAATKRANGGIWIKRENKRKDIRKCPCEIARPLFHTSMVNNTRTKIPLQPT